MANDLNQVTLIGRLTRDAELKHLNSGTAVSKFGLAVGRRRKQGDNYVDEVSFFDVTVWGRLGETLGQYLTKGKQICVSGELRQDRWEKDGQKHSKVEVVAKTIQLLGGGKSGGQQSSGNGGGGYNGNQQQGNGYQNQQLENSGYQNNSPDDFVDDDIPF